VFNVIKVKLSEITLKGKRMNLTEEQIMTIWNESFKVNRPRESMDEEDEEQQSCIEEEEDDNEVEVFEEDEDAEPITPTRNRRRRISRGNEHIF
jgi:hypothetical protein